MAGQGPRLRSYQAARSSSRWKSSPRLYLYTFICALPNLSLSPHPANHSEYLNPGLSSSVSSCIPFSIAARSLVCPAASLALFTRHI